MVAGAETSLKWDHAISDICLVLLSIYLLDKGLGSRISSNHLTNPTPQGMANTITPANREHKKYFQTFRKIGGLDVTSKAKGTQ